MHMWKEFHVVEMAEVVGLLSLMPRCLNFALYRLPEENLGSDHLSDLVKASEMGQKNLPDYTSGKGDREITWVTSVDE